MNRPDRAEGISARGFHSKDPAKKLHERVIGIKGAGEMGSAIAWRLHKAGLRAIFMMEAPSPLAVRRGVSFCEAIHDGHKTVEGIQAVKAATVKEFPSIWQDGHIAVICDPKWTSVQAIRPDVVIDAILAKRNLGTGLAEADLVIALGPGFTAPGDVQFVIETNRGHNLGRIITEGGAEPDTGIPGVIEGASETRLLQAPTDGEFQPLCNIGDPIESGAVVGRVGEMAVASRIRGVLRGLIRARTQVARGVKIGDIDPRDNAALCYTISDKARAISGAVLEAILRIYNR